MSERGSFVTEYIHCAACLEVAKQVLLSRHKYLYSDQLKYYEKEGGTFPIISGKVGDMWSGGELWEFEDRLIPALEAKICHPMRVAVLAEDGERIFYAVPNPIEDGQQEEAPTEEAKAPTPQPKINLDGSYTPDQLESIARVLRASGGLP
jgi:hypothetical protein